MPFWGDTFVILYQFRSIDTRRQYENQDNLTNIVTLAHFDSCFWGFGRHIITRQLYNFIAQSIQKKLKLLLLLSWYFDVLPRLILRYLADTECMMSIKDVAILDLILAESRKVFDLPLNKNYFSRNLPPVTRSFFYKQPLISNQDVGRRPESLSNVVPQEKDLSNF